MIDVKVEVDNNQADGEYPKLMSSDDGTIVLLSGPKKGMCIAKRSGNNFIGEYSNV